MAKPEWLGQSEYERLMTQTTPKGPGEMSLDLVNSDKQAAWKWLLECLGWYGMASKMAVSKLPGDVTFEFAERADKEDPWEVASDLVGRVKSRSGGDWLADCEQRLQDRLNARVKELEPEYGDLARTVAVTEMIRQMESLLGKLAKVEYAPPGEPVREVEGQEAIELIVAATKEVPKVDARPEPSVGLYASGCLPVMYAMVAVVVAESPEQAQDLASAVGLPKLRWRRLPARFEPARWLRLTQSTESWDSSLVSIDALLEKGPHFCGYDRTLQRYDEKGNVVQE